MLRTLVFPRGADMALEVKCPPAGQTLGMVQQGRRVHLWWRTSEVKEQDPTGYEALTRLVPGVDHVSVGRTRSDGMWEELTGPLAVVECGADDSRVHVTLQEFQRMEAPPAGAPAPPVGRPAGAAPGGGGPAEFFAQARAGHAEAPGQ